MALEYALPLDLVEEFKCFSCENYLSVFPVYLKNDGIGAICGRCVPSNQNDFIRDAAYETVAEFIQFPCSYKKNGCDEQLAPDALQKHELTECLFRLYRCPSEANTKCKWLGGYSDLVKHFKESHPNLLLKDLEFQISFDTSSKENLLLCFQNNLFVVKKRFGCA
ncbi:hypothetical protein NQ315_003352 [Exocentrus adspersus]|uniref:RING-type E3 ubiquitin transferase n=1 Tax=Exocentrus adspersus TaxID=1586481 RepID=A0AAV8VDH8_9CUCU|nr:hypothetical protein NQ315_003352 [Exocentrus adspersus]